MPDDELTTPVPTRWVGPIRVSGDVDGEQEVPLATFESPLWPSVGRGARVSRLVPGGVSVTVTGERMTRSTLFVAASGAAAAAAARRIEEQQDELAGIVAAGSAYARLVGVTTEVVGNQLFVRFALTTGDAAGHNMVTLAAEALMTHLLAQHPELAYGSISGNYCSDKKATAVNGILGRGRSVVADIVLPREVLEGQLRTTAERLNELNVRKNLVGSTIAGALRSANAHYANMLLAFYLATGQDAANIVEGSQGITYTEVRGDDLYFSCSLPSLIVGTVGNGKHLPAIETALTRLGCREDRAPCENARRLACLIAATVLCGELSLLAAQTNPGELMRSHLVMERAQGVSR